MYGERTVWIGFSDVTVHELEKRVVERWPVPCVELFDETMNGSSDKTRFCGCAWCVRDACGLTCAVMTWYVSSKISSTVSIC
ncbi:unnamed protein product [Gongylonema pulchrum]|uniref:Transposase n=1 Tax=Gongylonema pulchrum TaxID=637853 RepID=A0A183EVH9_9BILA|nr:unnamed protein product [Gongylonema pulchrum]